MLVKKRHAIGAAMTLLLATGVAAAAQPAQVSKPYLLGPQDVLKVTVHQWRANRDEVYEWTAPKGSYAVGSDGKLLLPFAGSVQAGGLTTEALSKAIAVALQQNLGLMVRPDASVSIVKHRPFYVLGVVEKAGEYPYEPGMTVIQAVSLAGGLYHVNDPNLLQMDREAISSEGDLRTIAAQRNLLLARRARLQAEVEGASTVAFPKELLARKTDPGISQILSQEDLLFQSRTQALNSEIDSLNQIKELLSKEVDSLHQKEDTQDKQLALAKKEFNNVKSLLTKGLAVTARELSAEQDLAQLQSGRLDLDLSILKAEQEISKTGRDILELRNNRRGEVLTLLNETQGKLEEATEKMITAQQLSTNTFARETDVKTGKDHPKLEPTFTIARKSDGKWQTISATQTTTVEPGDVITVQAPRRETVDASGLDLSSSSVQQSKIGADLSQRDLSLNNK